MHIELVTNLLEIFPKKKDISHLSFRGNVLNLNYILQILSYKAPMYRRIHNLYVVEDIISTIKFVMLISFWKCMAMEHEEHDSNGITYESMIQCWGVGQEYEVCCIF